MISAEGIECLSISTPALAVKTGSPACHDNPKTTTRLIPAVIMALAQGSTGHVGHVGGGAVDGMPPFGRLTIAFIRHGRCARNGCPRPGTPPLSQRLVSRDRTRRYPVDSTLYP